MANLFPAHLHTLQQRYQEALQYCGDVDRLLIHSGGASHYYADDQTLPFRAFGHFCQWLPVDKPGQLLLIEPGRRPVYFQLIPPDYWHDQSIDNAGWWAEEFEIIPVTDSNEIGPYLGGTDHLAFLGEGVGLAGDLGIKTGHINSDRLTDFLDYQRAYKTPYEQEQIRVANRQALEGHAAARDCFLEGGSEFAIHMAYLESCGITESECPYTNIVALNDKAAILHYQHKRRGKTLTEESKGQVLLIDAGCRVNNYCSDITRTWTTTTCHERFVQLVKGIERLEQDLVGQVRPRRAYLELHRLAMESIAALAIELELISCHLEEALALKLPELFMPHGIGHLLGIQVHDVGGHLAASNGSRRPPPNAYPFLRNTRIMAEDMVFTIEPGFYFIPLLLDAERQSVRGRNLNWRLIDELLPLGGVRIEDNVRVTTDGAENLTRQ